LTQNPSWKFKNIYELFFFHYKAESASELPRRNPLIG
jgi:hypothetical protein